MILPVFLLLETCVSGQKIFLAIAHAIFFWPSEGFLTLISSRQWTTVDVPWTADYNDTKFSVTVTKATPVVIALSKLDNRYFQGLEGQYTFTLHFRLEKDGEPDYIIRSHGNYLMDRSVNVDLDLEPGTYSVLMKITGKRAFGAQSVEQVIRDSARDRQDKLIQIGLAYDLAHAKGQIKETEEEKNIREERELKRKATGHQKRRKELREKWLKSWELNRKRVARNKRQEKRKADHDKKVEARNAAAAKATEQVDDADPATAGQDGEKAADQQEKEDSPETVKQDTPATTDESPGEVKPEEEPKVDAPEETKPDEKPEADTPKPEETKPAEPQPEDIPAGETAANEENSQGVSAEPQDDKGTAAEDKAAQFEAALQKVPSDVGKGSAPPTAAAGGTMPAPSVAAENNDWEYDSLASFSSSIVTDLDFPPSPPPEEEAAPVPAPANPDEEDENAEFENDPWNAVCVVGLKVYSKDKDLTILIVRPKSENDEEETQLDLDDNSKGASGETMKEEQISTGDTVQDDIKPEIKEGEQPGVV